MGRKESNQTNKQMHYFQACKVLKLITHVTDNECTSRCRSEVRRWQQGCYTLVHDTDTEGLEFALDLVLYVGCQGNSLLLYLQFVKLSLSTCILTNNY